MSMENLGPYSNFHELNQDWFLNEFNNVLEQWKTMQKNFNTLQDAFDDLKSYVQDYFKNLDVQDEINNKLNEMVASGYFDDFLNNYFKNLKKRKFIIIGDSYGENPYNYQGGWTTPFKSFSGLTEDDTCFTSCVGGSGFAVKGNTNKTFMELLENISITGNKNDITDILIAGGCNDQKSNFSDITTSILQMRNYIKENYPNANIWVAFIGLFSDPYKRTDMLTYVYRAYATSSNFGCFFIDGSMCIHRTDLLGDDKTHPVETGSINIGRHLFNSIYSGNSNILINYNIESIVNNDITGNNFTYNKENIFYGYSSGNTLHFGMIQNLVLTFENTITINTGDEIYIGTLKYSTLFDNTKNGYFPINCIALQSSGNIFMPAYLKAKESIYGNQSIDLYLVILTKIQDMDSVKQIQILPIDIIVNY